ncbi:MAG: Na/Pi cotransporter family protein, partial [Paramuribaculum sp.]|nr:Na/Pi cotransporter family protein [Paramuribaculum sp.]
PSDHPRFLDITAAQKKVESLQQSVSIGLAVFHTVFNLINLAVMIWLTGLYVKIVMRLVPAKHKEDEEFQLKFISGGLMNAAELNIAQAEKEIAVYGERVARMIDMAKTLVHTDTESEEYAHMLSRLEKYEDISDRMEIEIAHYLNRCSEGRLSNEGKLHIAAMLRIVSEIESIADCCLGAGRILERKNQAHVEFTETIYANIDAMFQLVKEAMDGMLRLLHDPEHAREPEIIVSYNKEREINNYRNQLRAGNIENINSHSYPYQAGIYYMDMISNLEKTGDYIINVVDAIKEQLRRQAV